VCSGWRAMITGISKPRMHKQATLAGSRFRDTTATSRATKLRTTPRYAASPQETRLRLLFIDAGLPKPTTQITIYDQSGRYVRTIDLGWEDFNVGAEYDGEQHRTNRAQYVKDQRVWPKLRELGWHVVRAIKEDRDADLVREAWDAMVSRGWSPN